MACPVERSAAPAPARRGVRTCAPPHAGGSAASLAVRWWALAVCAHGGRALAPLRRRLSHALAAEVAGAPAAVLAAQRPLLELLRLATGAGLLAEEDVARHLADDRVMARLLGSALRWGAMGARDPADPPRLAWAELREVAGGPLLRSRIAELARDGAGRDAWDRLAVQLAAERAGRELGAGPA
ncbi:MAG TPA: hypothetical protein VFP65_12260 [Anaeromyxobacteraceae bacterium]|nr:hypothetical protein [Anaeromyxobacteraceae bacterium]